MKEHRLLERIYKITCDKGHSEHSQPILECEEVLISVIIFVFNQNGRNYKAMSRYLDPKTDVVFKKIFGDHPRLLISFLNAVLPLSADNPIVTLSYLPTEQVPSIPTFKRTVADVKCTDAEGRVFIVEMQINWTDSFKQRLLFGASQAFVKQLEKGEDYRLLQPVYGLGIVASIYDQENPAWYHHYRLVKEGGVVGDVIEQLQLIFIELPKFPVHSTEEKKLRLLWLRFLREIGEKTTTVAQELLDVPEISEAISLTEQAAYTSGELTLYENYWDSVSREKTLLSGSYRQGEAKGIEKGRQEGLEQERRKTAKRMLALGSDDAFILQLTDLSKEELTLLKAEMGK